MIDMQYTPAERKEETAEIQSMEAPKYPWGLQIRLEAEELAKLGIDKMPRVGEEIPFTAVGRVVSVSQAERGDEEEKCVSVQIVAMDLGIQMPAATSDNANLDVPPKPGGSILSKYRG